MTFEDKSIQCDVCGKSFSYRSIKIKESSVEIAEEVFTLDYFTCPHCNAVYKVLLVDKVKYRELVDDYVLIQARINRQQGKGNPELVQKLQSMANKKQQRLKAYVQGMNEKYPGSFVLATENNQQREQILYLPREGAE